MLFFLFLLGSLAEALEIRLTRDRVIRANRVFKHVAHITGEESQ